MKKKLEVGAKAPLFNLKNELGEKISLKSFLGRKVLVYFYPKAMTPGCTIQAQGIRDSIKDFKKIKMDVLAISPDLPEKLLKFKLKHDLNFNLLSDNDLKVSTKYGVYGEKKFMGKTYMGIIRTSFILDETGKIVKILDKVKTKTHHKDVIKCVS